MDPIRRQLLKAAGLFEKYSKDKAGYDKLTVEKA